MADKRSVEAFGRRIIEAAGAYRMAQIYITFAELDIGSALEHGPLSAADLAARTSTDEAALKRFIDAAAAFDLVRWREDASIEMTELASDVLTPGGSHSIANLLKLEGAFYQRWGRLDQAVRSGTRPAENRAQEDDPGWVRRFTLAVLDRARQSAPAVAEAIDVTLPPVGSRTIRLIDVGGGHGAYSLAVAERRPDIEAIVFDLPAVIEVTHEIISASKVSDRVRAIAGDFHEDPLGNDFDIVLLFGILHGETPERAPQLIQSLQSALKPGGLLLIRSHGRRIGGAEPGERELFDLHMLLSTDGGGVRRPIDTTRLVEENGFRSEAPVDIPASGGGMLLVFRREP